ncbi:MAG: hypothetical protein WC307_05480 [Candidatus Nanoarchaeia archaeon]|jgi:hypothetical protein
MSISSLILGKPVSGLEVTIRKPINQELQKAYDIAVQLFNPKLNCGHNIVMSGLPLTVTSKSYLIKPIKNSDDLMIYQAELRVNELNADAIIDLFNAVNKGSYNNSILSLQLTNEERSVTVIAKNKQLFIHYLGNNYFDYITINGPAL